MKEFRQVAGKTRSAVPAFLLGNGPDRQMHTLIDAYCPDPSCPGSEVSIRLFPERGSSSPLSFGIDLFQPGLRMPVDFTEAAKAITMDFANAQWNLLARRRQVVRAWGLMKLRRRKEYHPGETFSFQEFQARPDHWAMPFDHEGLKWSALDASCVHPECPCTDVQLNFFQEGKGREGTGAIQADFVALLDLKTGAIRGAGDKPLSADRMAVVGSFQESLGDWCGELSLRRDLIRRIARKRIRFPSEAPPPAPRAAVPSLVPRAEAEPPRPSPESVRKNRFDPLPPAPIGRRGEGGRMLRPAWGRVRLPHKQKDEDCLSNFCSGSEGTIIEDHLRPGRNDPCSCGSGKKFKKCCGR